MTMGSDNVVTLKFKKRKKISPGLMLSASKLNLLKPKVISTKVKYRQLSSLDIINFMETEIRIKKIFKTPESKGATDYRISTV